MGFGVRNVEELLDCLGASKKEWALILLLDQEHQTSAGREIVRGDLNLLTQLDEDSGNLFDFYIPGYCVSPKSCNLDNWDDPYEIRKLYQGSHLNSVGAVELKRLGVLCFSRLDFRTFWVEILSVVPSLEYKIPFDTLSADDTVILLKAFPRFAGKCEWGRVAMEFRWGICKDLPELAQYFPWDCKDCQPWLDLLRVMPEYADRCPWNKFVSGRYEEFWLKLLLARPALVKYYGNARSLSAAGWRQILRAHPELANNFSAWSVFDGADWAHLLSRRPALAPYCDANDGWKKFLPDDWIWLLRYRPYFKEKRTYNRVFQ